MDIKFRAWDKEKERMRDVTKIRFGNDRLHVHDYDREIKNVELMQYTGLKDKNGVEIYDGDVLEFDEYEESFDFKYYVDVGVVEEGLVTLGRDIGSEKFEYSNFELVEMASSGKIIGNIMENPELLKENAE